MALIILFISGLIVGSHAQSRYDSSYSWSWSNQDTMFIIPFDNHFFPEGIPEFFGDGFMDPLDDWDFDEFPDHGTWHEWLEQFFRDHPILNDSLHHFRQQHFHPHMQKKSWREVEI